MASSPCCPPDFNLPYYGPDDSPRLPLPMMPQPSPLFQLLQPSVTHDEHILASVGQPTKMQSPKMVLENPPEPSFLPKAGVSVPSFQQSHHPQHLRSSLTPAPNHPRQTQLHGEQNLSPLQLAGFNPPLPVAKCQMPFVYTTHQVKDVAVFSGSTSEKHGLKVEDWARDMSHLPRDRNPATCSSTKL